MVYFAPVAHFGAGDEGGLQEPQLLSGGKPAVAAAPVPCPKGSSRVRVVAFNSAEGWLRDDSKDVAPPQYPTVKAHRRGGGARSSTIYLESAS